MLVNEGGELLEVDIDNSIFYFNELNRGGLIYPSSTSLYGFYSAHAIFNTCSYISGDFKKLCVKLQSPKRFSLHGTVSLSIGIAMV